MRELINLVEGVQDNHLYHGTNADRAEGILHTNILEARTEHSDSKLVTHNGWNKRVQMPFRPKTVSRSGYVSGTSMTRSLLFATQWATPVGVVFVFDRAILQYTNRIVSFQYYPREAVRVNEMEDFVVGPVNNIDRAIVEIRMSQFGLENLHDINSYHVEDQQPFSLIVNHPKLRIV